MITSRPPTAVTTSRVVTPAAARQPVIASDTMPGSMISPSTIASASRGVIATLTSSGSSLEWSITATLMRPEPMSRPTVVFLRPNSAISCRRSVRSDVGLRRAPPARASMARTDGLSPRHEWRAREVTVGPERTYGSWAHHQPGRRRYRRLPGDPDESGTMRTNPRFAASPRAPPDQARALAVTRSIPFPSDWRVTRVVSAPAVLEPDEKKPRGLASNALSGCEARKAENAVRE